jgi:hypothetical protein
MSVAAYPLERPPGRLFGSKPEVNCPAESQKLQISPFFFGIGDRQPAMRLSAPGAGLAMV